MPSTTTIDIVQNFGFLGAFFILIASLGIYAAKRCLNKDNGILTLLAQKHINFLDKTIEANRSLIQNTEKIFYSTTSLEAEVLSLQEQGEKLSELHTRSDSSFSTVRLHNAANEAIALAESMCNQLNINCSEELGKIRRALAERS